MKSTFFVFASFFALHGVVADPIKIALTFDDGFDHHLTLIAPMLEKYGYRGAFNIVTDNMGRIEDRLTWDEVRKLKKRGHDIFSHSRTHVNLARLYEDGLVDKVLSEIIGSSAAISREIGESPKVFCFPFNAGEGVYDMVRAAGMVPMQVTRVNFGDGTWTNGNADIGAHIKALYASGAKADALMIHGVGKKTGAWRPFVDAAHFEQFLKDLKGLEKSGTIKVVPYMEISEIVAPDSPIPVKVIFDI